MAEIAVGGEIARRAVKFASTASGWISFHRTRQCSISPTVQTVDFTFCRKAKDFIMENATKKPAEIRALFLIPAGFLLSLRVLRLLKSSFFTYHLLLNLASAYGTNEERHASACIKYLFYHFFILIKQVVWYITLYCSRKASAVNTASTPAL